MTELLRKKKIRERIDEICMLTEDYAMSFNDELETLYKQLKEIDNA